MSTTLPIPGPVWMKFGPGDNSKGPVTIRDLSGSPRRPACGSDRHRQRVGDQVILPRIQNQTFGNSAIVQFLHGPSRPFSYLDHQGLHVFTVCPQFIDTPNDRAKGTSLGNRLATARPQ